MLSNYRSKPFFSVLLAIFLLSTSMVFADNTPATITVHAKHPQFTIQLKSNPSTGYRWVLREYSERFLQMEEHHFQPAKTRFLVGAPGYEVWTFHVKPTAFVTAQSLVIRFAYIRPWEANRANYHDAPKAPSAVFHVLTVK